MMSPRSVRADEGPDTLRSKHPAKVTVLAISPSQRILDVADLGLELLQLLLDVCVLLGHLLVLGLPLVSLGLEGLDFSLEVSRLDIGLPEPRKQSTRCQRLAMNGRASAATKRGWLGLEAKEMGNVASTSKSYNRVT